MGINKQYSCPSCCEFRNQTEIKRSLQLLKDIYRKKMPNLSAELKRDLVQHLGNEEAVWACDYCFGAEKAIEADPSLIYFSGEYPLAHFDEEKDCEACQATFVFSKEEKKHWYEKLGFYFEATRKYCPSCQAKSNKGKTDQKRISTLLKTPSDLNKNELQEISQIYLRMGKEEKAKKYMTLARKKN